MKISIGVILYYPTDKNLYQIKKLQELKLDIYLYDNTDNIHVAKYNENYFKASKIFKYISNLNNNGMSIALNKLCETAILNKDTFLITLDQDSIFEESQIIEYIQNIAKISKNESDVGAIGPEINYHHKTKVNTSLAKYTEFEYTDWIITSGTAINLKVYKKTAGFDEKYFIDRVDIDYCKQLTNAQYKILRVKGITLEQQLGDDVTVLSLFKGSSHNPLRHYYMFRNRLYYNRKFYTGIVKCKRNIIGSLHQIFNVLFFEKQKTNKIIMLYKGYLDFKNNKMYEYEI